jgi:alpha-1,3-glucosyltransferase
VPRSSAVFKIAQLGIVVIATFVICWLPFIMAGQESVLQVLHRLFPFARGVFEDKVANFWCAISPFWKLKYMKLERATAIW